MKRSYRVDVANVRRSVAAIFVFVFCAVQLSGCGVVDKHFTIHDNAPSTDIDVSKVHDAVPKVEPHHPYGTRDYVVGGRHYRVLKTSKGYVKKGMASWYGTKFHGKHTSTQEKFNLYGMTAASPELPLPSYVRVTNLRNGKQIVVRVNDRGPFYGNRIIDLSYVAAKKLGFAGHGVAPVKVEGIDPRTYAKAESPSKHEESLSKDKQPSKERVFLQVGAFTKLENAKQLSDKVNELTSNPVQIKHKENLYRVQVGPLASAAQGNKLKNFLEDNGIKQVSVVDG